MTTVVGDLIRVVDVLSFVYVHFRALAEHLDLAERTHASEEHIFEKVVAEKAVHHLLSRRILPSVGPVSRRGQ